MKPIEKEKGQHWTNFKALHSVATSMWVEENFGKSITQEQFIKEHEDTCMAKRHTFNECGKGLFNYLVKFNWIKDADSE